jgi:hypothetical protein
MAAEAKPEVLAAFERVAAAEFPDDTEISEAQWQERKLAWSEFCAAIADAEGNEGK